MDIFTLFGSIEIKDKTTKAFSDIEKKLAKTAKFQGQTISQMSNGLSTLGSNMTKYLAVPIIGLGGLLGKMGLGFEQNFSKVSTLLDENVVDFDKYKKSLIKGSNDSKVAVDDFSESVYSSISAGVDQTKAVEFTTKAMALARGGFTSGAKAVDVMTTAINAYGLESEDADRISDMLITTQNLGKTTVDELAGSMGEHLAHCYRNVA